MAEALTKQQLKQTDQRPFEYKQAVENSIRSPPLGYMANSHNIKYTYRFKEDIGTYRSLIGSLENAFSKPVFCCGGRLKLQNMEKFVMKLKPSTSNGDKKDWKEFKLSDLPVDELLEYCDPAPFGDLREMKTVFDSEVRLAYEIKSERFDIGRERLTPSLRPFWLPDFPGKSSIQDYIEDTLTPGRYVRLNPYKVNVYSEGGFFKPHIDSPSGDEMIGTLVLCLPSPHKGGELCVNHDGLQHVFDFSKESGDTTKVQWAAFYSDCIHEVKPVLHGHRLTVTYKITLPNDLNEGIWYFNKSVTEKLLQKEHFETSVENPSITTKALVEVNSELEKIRCQGKSSSSRVGLILRHKYVSNGLQPHLLKGEDKALFDFLVEKQWKCKLVSVLSRYQSSVNYDLEDLDLDESHKVYEFKIGNRAHLSSTTPTVPFWRFGIPFLEIYRGADIVERLVRNNEGRKLWISNECEDVDVDKIYLDSAIIVELAEKPQSQDFASF